MNRSKNNIVESKDFHKKIIENLYKIHDSNRTIINRSGEFLLRFRESISHNITEEKQSPGYYLERYDKVHNFEKSDFQRYREIIRADIQYTCLVGYVKGKCKCGKSYAKAIVCGKEWCPSCGRKLSMIHQRRIARWFSKVMSTSYMGMLTVTIPAEARKYFLDQNNLSAYRLYVKRYLKRHGIEKGLSRYHWAGDCDHCKGEGCHLCRHTGSKNTFTPHIHILHDIGFLPKKMVQLMKKDFRRWIERRCNIKLRYDVVIHNEYCQPEDEAKKMHLLKYTTRATWRDAKNLDVINVIKGFRTTSSWGKWPETVEQPKSVKIDSGHCPACGDSLQFEKLKAPREFFADGNMLSAEIEAGFYFVIELSEEPRGSP